MPAARPAWALPAQGAGVFCAVGSVWGQQAEGTPGPGRLHQGCDHHPPATHCKHLHHRLWGLHSLHPHRLSTVIKALKFLLCYGHVISRNIKLYLVFFPLGVSARWVGAMVIQGAPGGGWDPQGGSTRCGDPNHWHCAPWGSTVHLAGWAQAHGAVWTARLWQNHDPLQCS